jgi:hypothetical protein
MGLKQLGQAARAVKLVVHGVEQRQEVVSYKMMSCFSDEKISPSQKCPYFNLQIHIFVIRGAHLARSIIENAC